MRFALDWDKVGPTRRPDVDEWLRNRVLTGPELLLLVSRTRREAFVRALQLVTGEGPRQEWFCNLARCLKVRSPMPVRRLLPRTGPHLALWLIDATQDLARVGIRWRAVLRDGEPGRYAVAQVWRVGQEDLISPVKPVEWVPSAEDIEAYVRRHYPWARHLDD